LTSVNPDVSVCHYCKNKLSIGFHVIDAPKKTEELHWLHLRQIVLLRDKYECQCKCTEKTGFKCASENRDLDIHHIIPRSLGGTNHIDNLITLCERCHQNLYHNPYR